MRRSVTTVDLLTALALLSCCLAQSVEAQRTASIVVGVRIERDSSPVIGSASFSRTMGHEITSNSASHISRYALIGAGIGAATGLVAAVIATNKASVTDHSEDVLAYIYFPAFGALVGLVVGISVGVARWH